MASEAKLILVRKSTWKLGLLSVQETPYEVKMKWRDGMALKRWYNNSRGIESNFSVFLNFWNHKISWFDYFNINTAKRHQTIHWYINTLMFEWIHLYSSAGPPLVGLSFSVITIIICLKIDFHFKIDWVFEFSECSGAVKAIDPI